MARPKKQIDSTETVEKEKRPRKSKKEALEQKKSNLESKVNMLKSRLSKSEEDLQKVSQQLELLTNEELRKSVEKEQKQIVRFLQDNGITLAQLEEMLVNKSEE